MSKIAQTRQTWTKGRGEKEAKRFIAIVLNGNEKKNEHEGNSIRCCECRFAGNKLGDEGETGHVESYFASGREIK